VSYDKTGKLLPILREVRNFYRKVIVAREAHNILEGNVKRDAVDILEFLQFLAVAQIEDGQNSSFADHCHFLL